MQLKLSESRLTRIKRSRHQETEEPIIIADSGESFVAKRLFCGKYLEIRVFTFTRTLGKAGCTPAAGILCGSPDNSQQR
jgi:hypothetical protein